MSSGQILEDPNLLVCIEDQIYPYKQAIQIIIAQMAFNAILPNAPKSFNEYASDYEENLGKVSNVSKPDEEADVVRVQIN